MTSSFIISQVLVGAALITNLLSFQFKKRATVIALLTTSAVLVAGQLYFLGQIASALLVCYAVVYFLVSIKTIDTRVMIAFMIGTVAIFAIWYSSWLDWFMLVSSFLTLLSLYNADQRRLRQFQSIGSIVRITYYSILFSPVGIVLEVVLLISNIVAYWRFYLKKTVAEDPELVGTTEH